MNEEIMDETECSEEELLCLLCLQERCNAKSLNCDHVYCKLCLDSILEFRADGSASITCPVGCEQRTEITANQTTNDLEAFDEVEDDEDEFLEEMSVQSDDVKKEMMFCNANPKCKRSITDSCPICCMKLCEKCKQDHKHEELRIYNDIEFIPVKYKRDTEELVPWCGEHAAYCTYICHEGFICAYCKVRSHSNHHYEEIETLSRETEEWVKKQEIKIPNLKEAITHSKTKTNNEMTLIRQNFVQEIKRRKYIAIQEYLKKINEEEEMLLKELDLTMAEHINSYPLFKPTDYLENIPKYEMFTNKHYIQDCVENITSDTVVVPSMTFNFTIESMNKAQPLGILDSKVDVVALTDGLVTVSSHIEEGKLPRKSLETLTENLKFIREEFEKLNEESLKDRATKIDSKSKNYSMEEKKRFHKILRNFETRPNDEAKMCYLCDLIANDDMDGYKFMWRTLPKHLLALEHNSYNMLHYAATFDKPEYAKIVLEAGANIDKHSNGVTALLMATAFGNLNTVKMLVECDADILIDDVDVNAVDVAKMVYNPDIVDYLTNHLKKCKMNDNGMLSEKNLDKTIRALAIVREQTVQFDDSDDDLFYHSSSE